MQHDPPGTSEPAPPDPTSTKPRKDPNLAARPSRIGFVRNVVRRLLDFGRHLSVTVKQRAEAPNFSAIAVTFGTARVTAISAHLQRGILRAIALDNVLRERLAAGIDLEAIDPFAPLPSRKPAPGDAAADPAAASDADASADPAAVSRADSSADAAAATDVASDAAQAADPSADASAASGADLAADPAADPSADLSAAQAAALAAAAFAASKAARRRLSRPLGWDDPELFMPTLKELEAQIRRRPIGRTIVDICLDLGITPGFCTGQGWNRLLECIHFFGGSLNKMRLVRQHRRAAFLKEWDRRPIRERSNFRWWDLGRTGEREALGFLFDEDPVNPFDPKPPAGAVIATGPP